MFANAEWLTDGMSTTDRGITVGATKEAGEPSHAGNPGGHSVWYRLNTNSAQQLTLDTRGSGFDTLLAVYTGPQVATVSTLTPLVSNDDAAAGTTTSQVSFATAANGTYYIAVDGKNGEVGSLHLNLSFAPLPPPQEARARASTSRAEVAARRDMVRDPASFTGLAFRRTN